MKKFRNQQIAAFLRPVQKIVCVKLFSVYSGVDRRLWLTGLFRFHRNSSFKSSSERNLNYAYILNLFVLFSEKN